MKNKTWLSLLTVFIYLTGANICLYAQEAHVNSKEKPNIIFLLTDDQRWNAMGAMGNEIIKTPNMDALAENGVLFKNAFVTTPICSVSRASFLSGQYARRHGIWNFSTFFSDSALARTYPMMLHQHGYYTGFIGKWGVGDAGKGIKIAGTEKTTTGKEVMDLLKRKFDYWRGWSGQGRYIHKLPNGKTIHVTRIVQDQTLKFLDKVPEDQPFSLSISFKAPHVQDQKREAIPLPGLEDLYQNVMIPKPPTASLKYFKMLPAFLQSTESRVRWIETYHMRDEAIDIYGKYLSGKSLKRWKNYYHSHTGQHHTYQEAVKNYYRLITGVDMVIGNIREKLKKMGVADNTVIILMGDNGMLLGDHGLTGKWYGYKESIRVPLVIYNPLASDSGQGQVRKEMALNIDIAPTILDLAGIEIPRQMQGRTLVPLLKGKHPQWRNDFLFEHLFRVNWVDIPMSQGVISKRYVYLQYLDNDYNIIYEQLFDMKKDPYQVHNLARNPDYFKILETLRNRMHSLIQQKK